MRSILFIITLSFLSISNAYALKFEYCYNKEVMDKKVEERLIEKDMFGKFNNEKFENIYYQVFSDGNAEQVIIKTDKWHKESSKNIDEEYEGENFTLEQLALMKQKIRRFNYKVIFVNENYIKLEGKRLHKKLAKKTITLNLKNGEIRKTNYLGKLSNVQQCKISKKGKSGYLDYWWALILIIAITFFVYTQSATRLKKLKIRK